jgi:hypothetical protein
MEYEKFIRVQRGNLLKNIQYDGRIKLRWTSWRQVVPTNQQTNKITPCSRVLLQK